MRLISRSARRRAARYVAVCALAGASAVAPAAAAQAAVPQAAAAQAAAAQAAVTQAAVSCEVTYRATHWNDGPRSGGFQATVTVTNTGAPLNGWTLALTLPAGHNFQQGWAADWSGSTGRITASNKPWNAVLATGRGVGIGFIGRWTGAFVGTATAFEVNGVPCGGQPPANRPPTVTLTSPAAGSVVLAGSTITLAADATDPDGAVDTVQFFIGDALVGTDRTAPYQVQVPAPTAGTGPPTAFARVFDNGSPPLTGDSARVPFSVVTVPPLSIVAQPTALSVTEGRTTAFDLKLSAPAANAEVALTVAGAPGVTVSPTQVAFGPDRPTQRITVTAAPGSGGTVATITAAAGAAQHIGSATVTVTVLDAGDGRVANPYQGAEVYVNADWAGQALNQAANTPGALGAQMARVATYPTAVWLDSIDAVTGSRGLVRHLDAAVAQQRRSGAGAMVVQLVLYDVPARDCIGRAAPGELTVDAADQQRYRTEFVDPIAEILRRPAYADLRVVTVIEPGALPDVAFSPPYQPLCTAAATPHVGAVRYALSKLSALPNAYNYLDFSYSANFGYPDNLGPAATLYADVVGGSGGPGMGSVVGFVTDARQYVPLTEPFIPSGETVIGGSPVYQSAFFDFNRQIHELTYAQAARVALIEHGFPSTIGMVIDTSRNGWGGPGRPTVASASLNVNTFVDESRIDRRPSRESWCNQTGAGIGARPQASPAPGIHAYAWVTPPGESDGVSSPDAPADPDKPYLVHRNECDPNWIPVRAAVVRTNALPGAPHAGRWFPEFFAQLVTNAYPPVPAT